MKLQPWSRKLHPIRWKRTIDDQLQGPARIIFVRIYKHDKQRKTMDVPPHYGLLLQTQGQLYHYIFLHRFPNPDTRFKAQKSGLQLLDTLRIYFCYQNEFQQLWYTTKSNSPKTWLSLAILIKTLCLSMCQKVPVGSQCRM